MTPAQTGQWRSRFQARACALVALGLLAAAPRAAGESVHPLDPLSASEIGVTLTVLRQAGQWSEEALFPRIALSEPDKSAVLAWRPGDPIPRKAALTVKKGTGVFEAVVDLDARRVASWKPIEGVQPGLLVTEEWGAAQKTVRRHAGWREAIRKRGIRNNDAVVLVPMTVGHTGAGKGAPRLVRVMSFDASEVQNHWGRPVEGLFAVVDLDRGSVVELVDTGVVPVPKAPADFDEGGAREVRDPFAKADPDSGIELEGNWIAWKGWKFHWRFDPRLGLVVSLASFESDGRSRRVLYQASLSEMFVPYTDPDRAWAFRAFLDAGEYGLGRLSSDLEVDLDCPAGARFLAAAFADDWGNPYFRRRLGCVFERSTGDVLWRHHEGVTGRTLGRKLNELVLRQVATVGNYDYVLDWIFRPDASIRIAVGATGVPAVRAVRGRVVSEGEDKEAAYGRRVAEHLVAVSHDHFFSYRLDLDVDGRDNRFVVDRLEPARVEGDEGEHGTWTSRSSSPATESEAKLTIDLERPALWRVVNPSVRSRTGYPVSYQLVPGRNAVSLFGAQSAIQKRAGFTDYHLWVTPYAEDERYAAGEFPNQSRGGEGLPSWTQKNRSIRDTDLVLWYTLGMHHLVRTEDWPVQPTVWSSFELRPFDFFTRNPALELPDWPASPNGD